MVKIVLASNNVGKIRELRALLAHLNVELMAQADLGIPDADETGLTFIENALIKARHASKLSGLPAIADDSGLAVQALAGAPGIYSARYAGPAATADANITKLLATLTPVPPSARHATYHCVLVYLQCENDPTPIVCDGAWPGMILTERQGTDGFGYDPVFYLPDHQKTAAELPAALKNQISHRGIAMRALLTQLMEKI